MDVAKFWVCSSPGRAPDLHSGGREFDPLQIHHFVKKHPSQKERLYIWLSSSVGSEQGAHTSKIVGSNPTSATK